jgi:hypothetical protein
VTIGAVPSANIRPRTTRVSRDLTDRNGGAMENRRDEPQGGDLAEGEETLPRDEHVGSFAEGEETRPEDDRIGSFAETDEQTE